MPLLGIDHVALTVADLPRAIQFYSATLGLRPVDTRDPNKSSYFWLSCGPAQSVNLTLDPAGTPNALNLTANLSNTPHLALTCPAAQLDALHDQLKLAGATLVHRSETGIYFCDPDGNFLEVTAWRELSAMKASQQHW